MKKREAMARAAAMGMMLVMALGGNALADEGGNPLDHNGDGKLIVGIEVQNMKNDWSINYAKVVGDFWEENGADEVIVSSSDMDVNKEISDIESFTAANVDVAVIVPNSVDSINDAVQQARKSGMLVTVNATQDQIASDCGSTFDHYQFGKYIGETAGDWLISKGYEKEPVILDTYNLVKQELVDRYEGMKDGLLEKCPDINIAMETVSADEGAQTTNTELALTSVPDAKAILTLWDGLAALEVCKTLGYNTEDFGLFCGEQSDRTAEALISEECYRSFLNFGNDENNILTSKELLKALKGEEYSNEVKTMPKGSVTKENVYEVYPDLKK